MDVQRYFTKIYSEYERFIAKYQNEDIDYLRSLKFMQPHDNFYLWKTNRWSTGIYGRSTIVLPQVPCNGKCKGYAVTNRGGNKEVVKFIYFDGVVIDPRTFSTGSRKSESIVFLAEDELSLVYLFDSLKRSPLRGETKRHDYVPERALYEMRDRTRQKRDPRIDGIRACLTGLNRKNQT
jgi:hypothetical protein